jgi:hypothetical protein
MKKVLSLLTLAALAVGLVGCGTTSNTNLGPPLVRLGVSSGASYSLLKYPQAVPAVRASAAIICSQAAGTNLAPAEVVAAVDAYAEKTPESVLIVNSALSLYTLVWNGYGAAAVTNTPALKLYLAATCDGLNDALATVPAPGVVRNAPPQNPAWPQVKFK